MYDSFLFRRQSHIIIAEKSTQPLIVFLRYPESFAFKFGIINFVIGFRHGAGKTIWRPAHSDDIIACIVVVSHCILFNHLHQIFAANDARDDAVDALQRILAVKDRLIGKS